MRRQKKLAVKVEKIEDKQNENWEIVVLISFLIIVLLVKTAQPFDYRLSHPYPYFYLASDAFFHIAYSQQVQDSGVYKNPPPYTTAGYSDVIAQNPPIWYILIAMFSYITGVETYDTSYLVTSLLFAFSSLIMYFAIRKHNTKIAIAALPFCVRSV